MILVITLQASLFTLSWLQTKIPRIVLTVTSVLQVHRQYMLYIGISGHYQALAGLSSLACSDAFWNMPSITTAIRTNVLTYRYGQLND